MANFDVSNADFSTVLRQLEITDRGHADTFNPLFLRLIKNDAFLKAYVDQQISNLINGAPGALDTLKELADALGDDANFKTTILTTIAAKVAQADFNNHANALTAHGIGDRTQLKTTAKDTIVNALNELKTAIPSVPVQSVNGETGSVNLGASDITVADSSKHFTSNPKNIENVLAELFTNVDNGQSNVYSAIVGKGVTPASKQFSDLAAGINSIARGQGNAVESQVRAGVKFSNSDGTLRTGTLPVQATATQTITPGTNDIIKSAGIYDGSITVKGDSNLASTNIKAGSSIFGVSGKSSVVDTADATALTADKILNGYSAYANGSKINGSASSKQQDISTCLINMPLANGFNLHFNNCEPIGFDDINNLLWCNNQSHNSKINGFNSSGTLTKTIEHYFNNNGVGMAYMGDRCIVWTGGKTIEITDMNGTLICSFYAGSLNGDVNCAIADLDRQLVYILTINEIFIYNFQGTLIASSSYSGSSIPQMFITSNGCFVLTQYPEIWFIKYDGTVVENTNGYYTIGMFSTVLK